MKWNIRQYQECVLYDNEERLLNVKTIFQKCENEKKRKIKHKKYVHNRKYYILKR